MVERNVPTTAGLDLDGDVEVRILAEGLDHPEGVTVGPDGAIYAGGEAGQIYRVDPRTGDVALYGSTGGFVLGLVLDGEGDVYCCDAVHGGVVRVGPDGDVGIVSSGCEQRSTVAANYPVFGPDGSLYYSDSGSWPDGGGAVMRVSPDGETTVWSEGPSDVTNGLALSPDDDYLYVVESTAPGVARVPIREDGTAGPVEQVLDMPRMVPDGLAFDSDGRLYVACYRPDAIFQLDPDGKVRCFGGDWQGTLLAAPTNVVFAGESAELLVSANLGRWHLSVMEAGATGTPLHIPSQGPPVIRPVDVEADRSHQ